MNTCHPAKGYRCKLCSLTFWYISWYGIVFCRFYWRHLAGALLSHYRGWRLQRIPFADAAGCSGLTTGCRVHRFTRSLGAGRFALGFRAGCCFTTRLIDLFDRRSRRQCLDSWGMFIWKQAHLLWINIGEWIEREFYFDKNV